MVERSKQIQIEFVPKNGTYVLETKVIESSAEAFISVDEAIQKKENESTKRVVKTLGYLGGGVVGILAGIFFITGGAEATSANVNSDHAGTIAAGVQLFMLGALSIREGLRSAPSINLSDKQWAEIKKAKKGKKKKLKAS